MPLFQKISQLLILVVLCNSFAWSVTMLDPEKRVIVGYWHNFDNGSINIKLKDIPHEYNVINVSFIENKVNSTYEVEFAPYKAAYPIEADFISDIALLKSQGKKVQISIGGQNGHIKLNSTVERDIFVAQTIAIIEKYGFNGLDIDLEGASIGSVNSKDFSNPQNAQITLFIEAVEQILTHFGTSFWLTAAPEIFYVQDALSSYGSGIVGAYLPFLYYFHSRIDVLHVQLYNSSNAWTDAGQLNQTSADFMVYMCDLLLNGFVTANGTGNTFPAFRPDQIAIGKPSTVQAAGSGYSQPSEIIKALDYLTLGKDYGSAYKIKKSTGYAGFRGVMTWSINWDGTQNYPFATTTYDYLSTLGDPPIVIPTSSSSSIKPSSSSSNTNTSSSSSQIVEGQIDCNNIPAWENRIYNWTGTPEKVVYQENAYSHTEWVNSTAPNLNSGWTLLGTCTTHTTSVLKSSHSINKSKFTYKLIKAYNLKGQSF